MVYEADELRDLVEDVFDQGMHCTDCEHWLDDSTEAGACSLLDDESQYCECPGLPDDVIANAEVR